MKLSRKKILIISLIIVIIFGWFFSSKNKKAKIEAENKAKMSYTVKSGDIKTEVKVTATANLANEQNLSFGREGKITGVYVKVGDEVKSGEVLAELDMDDYENSIQTSILELENANIALNKLVNNDTSLIESQLQNQIDEANSSYNLELEQQNILKNQLVTILIQRKNSLEKLTRDYKISEKNLELAKTELDVSSKIETEQTENSLSTRKQTINGIISSLNSNIGDFKSNIEKVDKIFGITEKYKDENDKYEDLLSAESSTLKNQTKNNVLNSYNLISKYELIIKEINENSSDNEINKIIQNFYSESEILVLLQDIAIDAIDASIVSVNNLSESDISLFINNLELSRSSIIGTRASLQSLSNSINSLLSGENQENQLTISLEQKKLNYNISESAIKKQKQDLITEAESVINLEKDHKNQLERKQNQINNIFERIELLKEELADIIDGADTNDIRQQKNHIEQAYLRLERTKNTKDNYQIIAEFDGRVRSIDIVEGEQYKLDDRNFIVIENPNLIELELQVNQIDIVKIEKGDPVIVTFDSYPNNPIEATVTNRNVNPEPNGRGGIYYKATIILEKQNLEILAGMSAIVNILTEEAKNVTLIPTLGLIQEGNKKYVYIKDGESYKRHEIKTGIVNNFQAEVIDGLIPGSIIKASVLDDEALKEMGIDDGSANPFGK